jgi:hypothetical protein
MTLLIKRRVKERAASFVFFCLCVSHSEGISRKFDVAEREGRRRKSERLDIFVNQITQN